MRAFHRRLKRHRRLSILDSAGHVVAEITLIRGGRTHLFVRVPDSDADRIAIAESVDKLHKTS